MSVLGKLPFLASATLLYSLPVIALLGSACGETVRPLSIHDSRIPLEARRWVADAEDAVSVTAAWRDAARDSVEETQHWHQHSVLTVKWPASPEAAAAQLALGDMANARIRLARLRLEQAEAELALAEIRRTQVNAETAVRYDLRSYDLDPFLDATRDARNEVERTARAVAEQRLVVEEATTEWWNTYSTYVAGGGDPRVLWVELR